MRSRSRRAALASAQILLFGRRVGEHARGGPGLEPQAAHRGANFRVGREHMNGGGHRRVFPASRPLI